MAKGADGMRPTFHFGTFWDGLGSIWTVWDSLGKFGKVRDGLGQFGHDWPCAGECCSVANQQGCNVFVGNTRIRTELLNGDQLVLFLSQVNPDFLHYITGIAFTLAGDALDVLRVYDDSGDHLCEWPKVQMPGDQLTGFYPILPDLDRFYPILPDLDRFSVPVSAKFNQFRMFYP